MSESRLQPGASHRCEERSLLLGTLRVITTLLVLVATLALLVGAQQTSPPSVPKVSVHPPPHLVISTEKDTFKAGEPILITAAFSADGSTSFVVNVRRYGFVSDSLGIDNVTVESMNAKLPPNVLPLHMLYQDALPDWRALQSEPQKVYFYLNDRLDLRAPGTYEFHYESDRVHGSANASGSRPQLHLISNSIRVRIVPATALTSFTSMELPAV